MTVTINLGFDRGNARTNVCTVVKDGKVIEIDESSVVAEFNYERYKTINAGASQTSLDANNLILEYDGTHYVFGELATKQGLNPSTGFADQDRYHGLHTKLAVMAFTTLLAQKVYPKYPLPYDLAANIVMGVPVKVFAQERSKIESELQNKSFRFKVGEREHRLLIQSVRVFMEGAGAAIYKGLSPNGLTAVIDPGSFTTNALIFDGMKPVQDLCRSFEIGVGTAIKRVKEKFANHYNREMEDHEAESILRAAFGLGDIPDDIYAESGLVSYGDLAEWMLAAVKATGEEIQSNINGVWKQKSRQVKVTLLVGGGSYYFYPQFKDAFSRVDRPVDSEKYNARGYAVLADQIAERNSKLQVVKGA